MKTTIKSAGQTFQPVTLSITIETLGEAIALLGRFNVPQGIVKQHLDWTRYIGNADFEWEDTTTTKGPFELLQGIVEQQRQKLAGNAT